MTLVQSVLGGNNSGTFNTSGGLTCTATATFGSNTTSGNLILAVLYHNQNVTSGVGLSPAILGITTAGVTWSANLLNSGFDAAPVREGCAFFAVGNAPSISSATTVSATLNNGTSSANGTEVLEFALYEFSGISTSFTNYNVGNGLVNAHVGASGTSSVPNAGNITTSATCLIVVDMKANSGNASAGSGYTFGQTMGAATFGQLQYQLNVGSGTIATAYAGTTETNWGSGAIAFQAPAFTPPTGTSVNYGYLFG